MAKPKKKPTRKRVSPEETRGMTLQIMPGRRVRLDPTIVPYIGAWLVAQTYHWQRVIDAADTSKTEGERIARRNLNARRRSDIQAVMEMSARLIETVPLDDIDTALERFLEIQVAGEVRRSHAKSRACARHNKAVG